MNIFKTALTGVSLLAISSLGSTAYAQNFNIQSATGTGSHASFPPSNVLDGDLSFASRWAGNASPEEIRLDLGSNQTVDDIQIAWGRGDSRRYTFEVAGRSGTSGSWTNLFEGTSSGNTAGFENYNLTDRSVRQVRIRGLSNSSGTAYTDITEVTISGTAGQSSTPTPTPTPTASSNGTFLMQKRNTGFSIDGAGGAQAGTQVYLWNTNTNNANQQWDEIDVGNGFTQYRKANTNLCFDAGNGASRRQAVRIETCNTNNQNQHWQRISQASGTFRLQKRNSSFSIDCARGAARRQECYLWNSSNGNVNQHFQFFEVGSTPTPTPTPTPTGDFNLNPNDEPWENFDLREWKIDTPGGENSSSDCDAQDFEPFEYNQLPNSRSRPFFFTHSDGGMRFIAEYGGGTTGGDCDDKSRSELREMLRGSNTSIDTTGKNGDYRNNWALGYQPNNSSSNNGESWGAREGRMQATLRINDVTESGSDNDQGNVVIGQIHADQDEPLRLHYRHRPGQARGCLWAASEIRNGDDVNFNIIGDRDCDSNNGPSNGIALNELFSYEIRNIDEDIIVTIRRGDRTGSVIESITIDLDQINSGYDVSNDWMYFKAGAYSQNDDGQIGDRDIVTFYRLDVDH